MAKKFTAMERDLILSVYIQDTGGSPKLFPKASARWWSWYRWALRYGFRYTGVSHKKVLAELIFSKLSLKEKEKLRLLERRGDLRVTKQPMRLWRVHFTWVNTNQGYVPDFVSVPCPICLQRHFTWQIEERGRYHADGQGIVRFFCASCWSHYPTCACCGCPSPDPLQPGTYYGIRGGICTGCARRRRPQSILSYSSRAEEVLPHPMLSPKVRYFGVELELESAKDAQADAFAVKTLLPEWVICKSDGSLTNGFETVTLPDTLDNHRKKWLEFLPKFPESLRGDSGHCGLHIHVSKAPLAPLQVARAVCFINEPKNLGMVEKVARRGSNTYSRIYKKSPEELAFLMKNNGTGGVGRYEAINLTNAHTIEFRLFKATKNPKVLVAALEFCDSVLDFCAAGNTGFQGLLWKDYEEWLRLERGRKHYPWIIRYIDKFIYNKPKPDAALVAKTRVYLEKLGLARARRRAEERYLAARSEANHPPITSVNLFDNEGN